MKNYRLLFVFTSFIFFSCSHSEKQTPEDYNAPVCKAAKGFIVPSDCLKSSLVTVIDETKLKRIKTGTVKSVPANANLHIAKEFPLIRLDKMPASRVCYPGKDSVLLPEKIQATGRIVHAGMPEIVVAKDAAFKDNNPDNFSYYKILQGLKKNNIRSFMQDKWGNIWIGSEGGGATKFDGKYFSHYSLSQGLPSANVISIVQDSKGNIWFGTEDGVARYDGKWIISYSVKEGMRNGFVHEIIEDRKGNMWIATESGGITKLVPSGDGRTAMIYNYGSKEGLSLDGAWCALEDKQGILWFGTIGGGVSKFEPEENNGNGKFTHITTEQGLTNDIIFDIAEDRKGNLYFASYTRGVTRYDGNRIDQLNSNKAKSHETTYDLLQENGQYVKTLRHITVDEGLSDDYVFCVQEDRVGNLWFTSNKGICKYDGYRIDELEHEGRNEKKQEIYYENGKAVKTFKWFKEAGGLSNNYVSCMLEDKSGSFWFGTFNGGVSRYDGTSFENFSKSQGISDNFVLNMLEDKRGNLWFTTNFGGLTCYDGKNYHHIYDINGLGSNYVFCGIQDNAGNLWFGTNRGGASKFEPDENGISGTFTGFSEAEGLNHNVITSILQDSKGNLWFGAFDEGLSKYEPSADKKTGIVKQYRVRQGLVGNFVMCLFEDSKGGIWIGTSKGLTKYEYANNEHPERFIQYDDKNGLTNNHINHITEDKDANLWLATAGGVTRFDGKTFLHFDKKHGLCDGNVASILFDKGGNAWFGTRLGLSVVSSEKLNTLGKTNSAVKTPEPGFFYNYEYNDGFIGANCRRTAVIQDSAGRIWWGADLLTCFYPDGDKADTTPPVVQITNLKLYGENYNWLTSGAVLSDSNGVELNLGKIRDTVLGNGVRLNNISFDRLSSWNHLPENLSLPYNNNNLSFSFIGIHMKDRNHIQYRHILKGYENNWSIVTDENVAHYGNLLPGKYIFNVQAMNRSGRWSKTTEFAFEVRPPWWQTWIFRGFVVIFVFSAIVFYIKWRERSLKQRQKELEVKVDEATFEIKEQKHIIEEKHKEITDSINYAERIQRSFLATKSMLDANLKDYFVLFMPKDVVSGDFYWAGKLKNNMFAIATADSTGHGVPGAIMSILNISSLEKAAEEGVLMPSEILDHTRRTIIERLKKDGSEEGGKDGMDCSLCVYDFANSKLFSAAANNPIWIVRNGEVIEIKADKMPVGKHDKQNTPFTLNELDLKQGDVVYTLTDGFPDQFGGLKGKKYMIKNLREFIVSNSNKSMKEQKQILENEFQNWKGNNEQVDDVCLIGIRV